MNRPRSLQLKKKISLPLKETSLLSKPTTMSSKVFYHPARRNTPSSACIFFTFCHSTKFQSTTQRSNLFPTRSLTMCTLRCQSLWSSTSLKAPIIRFLALNKMFPCNRINSSSTNSLMPSDMKSLGPPREHTSPWQSKTCPRFL